MLQKIVKSCKIFEKNVTSLLLLGIGYEEYPQTLGMGERVKCEKIEKKFVGIGSHCVTIYIYPLPPLPGCWS